MDILGKPSAMRLMFSLRINQAKRTSDTKVGIVMDHNTPDIAREVFTKSCLDGNLIEPPLEDKLHMRPYVVIGDFAYLHGQDGTIWMAPLKSHVYLKTDRTRVVDRTPDWTKAADVTWMETNLCKADLGVGSLLLRTMVVARNMRNSGVNIKTPNS